MEHSNFWSSAKNFFFSTPLSVGTEAIGKQTPKREIKR